MAPKLTGKRLERLSSGLEEAAGEISAPGPLKGPGNGTVLSARARERCGGSEDEDVRGMKTCWSVGPFFFFVLFFTFGCMYDV